MATVVIYYAHQATAHSLAQELSGQADDVKLSPSENGTYTRLILSLENAVPFQLVFNHEQGLINCSDTVLRSVLRPNHISTERVQPWHRRYLVHLVDNEAISVTRQNVSEKVGENPPYVAANPDDRETARAISLAARTLYVLGLDLGMVRIGVDSRYRLHVIEVNPSPPLRKKTVKKYAKAILKKIAQQATPAPGAVLGADPEFMLADTRSGRMIPASQFFPFLGDVGCDNIRMPNRKQRPVAELRPHPSADPLQVTVNLKRSMHQAMRLVPYRNIKWVAGSMPLGFPIGGHVHISGVPLSNRLLRALDNYLALPLLMLENPRTARERRKKYGFLGDYRIKAHGGFEYRTLSSWMVSPQVATGVLALTSVIVAEYPRLGTNHFLAAETQDKFYRVDREYFRPLFEGVWDELTHLPSYHKYFRELEDLAGIIRSGSSWDETADLRRNWGIAIPSMTYREDKGQTVRQAVVVRRN
jgi:hypothetical protein